MIYPKNASDKLGFEEIKTLVRDKCISDSGRELVDKIQPQVKFEQVEKFLRQAHEFKELIVNDAPLPVDHIYAIKPLAEKARIEGAFLLEEEFHRVLLSLRTVFAIIRYFNEREGQYAHLEMLFEHLPIEISIVRQIEKVIDDRGVMKDNASRLLLDLSQQIQKAEQEARKTLETVFKQAKNNGWTADGNLTIRDGRMCIPILAENKRKLKGLVHDESATGQTAFIEPEEVFHLNNKVRDLSFERRREVVRILTELTGELRPHVPLLLSYHGLLTKLDFVRAKALFAIDVEAVMPELSKDAEIRLVNARHPLLLLSERTADKYQPVVPLNMHINEKQRVVLVSGPNAGGKSVCMKTVGLLQLMMQSGLLIPADATSKMGIFKQLFADIGDDQSIESDLSTYSAHLSKMKHFSTFANARTLVLIDEFGTGTDPQFGGPIAEAVLESMHQKGIRGVITTHYSNLKLFANKTEGMENASMLFDNRQMQPLYILQVGKPGSSYAFEIAQKIGLPKEVLHLAKQKIGEQQQKVDTLLVDLERDKKEIFDTKYAISKREKELIQQQEEYNTLKSYIDENRKQLIREAKEEARQILKDANKLVENTIAEIKSVNADKEKTKELRRQLHQATDQHQVKPDVKKSLVQPQKTDELIEVGDWVRILDSGTEGEVIEVSKNKNLILALGDIRTVVKINRVEKLRGKEKSKAAKRSNRISTASAADFSPEIDVRGMRTEEALQQIELVLDRAVMIGYPSLKILHGKGDGILRRFIRDYLKKYSHVSRFEDEHADRGGDGVTYAYIG